MNSRPLDADIGIAGPAKEARLYGSLGPATEGPARGGGESQCGRVAEEDKGGQDDEEAIEVAGIGARRGDI